MPPPEQTLDEQILCNLLISLRKEANFTQKDLAEKLEVPQSFVSKYENCERSLRFLEINLICQALIIPLEEFAKRFETEFRKRN